jgi:predicted nuclease with TOPRIM domain
MNPNCQGKKIISKYRDCLACGQRERIWKTAVQTEQDFIEFEPKKFSVYNFEHLASPGEQLAHVIKCHQIHRSRMEERIKDLEARNRELNKEVQSLERTNWKRKYDKLKEKIEEAGSLVRSGLYELED